MTAREQIEALVKLADSELYIGKMDDVYHAVIDSRSALTTLLSELDAVKAREGWQPIEDAPDGITVLVANISSNGQVNWVRDGIRGKGVMRLTWYTLNGNHIPTPTHFIDLPNSCAGR